MSRAPRRPSIRRRAFLVVLLLLALAVLGRHLIRRTGIETLAGGEPAAGSGVASLSAPTLDDAQRAAMLAAGRAFLDGAPLSELSIPGDTGAGEDTDSRRTVVVSAGRERQPARVARGDGDGLGPALGAALGRLAEVGERAELAGAALKVDVLLARGAPRRFDREGRARLTRSLEGLELPRHDLVLLPEELLSRRLIHTDGDLQSKRLRRYLEESGRRDRIPADNPGRAGMPYHRLGFDSFTEGPKGAVVRLFRGNRREVEVSPETLFEAAVAGGEYLLRHQRADGTFGYSYQPKWNDYDAEYNLLRHAGTCYALAELAGFTGDHRYLEAAALGIDQLLGTHARPPKSEHAAAGFEAIVSPGEEAKLGGAALAILAILEHREVSGEKRWDERARRLARFLAFQQEADGHFFSKYFYGEPDPKPFESIYYPGEAILALARLHRVDGRSGWLEVSRKGADWLIDVRDAGKTTAQLPHDHWLLMGLEELHDLTGDRRYLEHALRIAQAIVDAQRLEPEPLDWVGTFYDPPRSTPTATRAEALVAMHRLAARNGVETAPYRQALLRMAAFQMRCQLRPENALYLPRPDLALGGFRRSLTNWEVRIDYVQHNLSALLGLRALLLETEA